MMALSAQPARAAEITLIAPGGIRDAIRIMIPGLERDTRHTMKATFGSGGSTKQWVMQGERFDVPVVQPPLASVVASGHVIAASKTPLASVPVAVVVRKGAVKPDISNAAAVKHLLLTARLRA